MIQTNPSRRALLAVAALAGGASWGGACGDCAFFTATQPAACGKCVLLSGGPVASTSVCNSWAARR